MKALNSLAMKNSNLAIKLNAYRYDSSIRIRKITTYIVLNTLTLRWCRWGQAAALAEVFLAAAAAAAAAVAAAAAAAAAVVVVVAAVAAAAAAAAAAVVVVVVVAAVAAAADPQYGPPFQRIYPAGRPVDLAAPAVQSAGGAAPQQQQLAIWPWQRRTASGSLSFPTAVLHCSSPPHLPASHWSVPLQTMTSGPMAALLRPPPCPRLIRPASRPLRCPAMTPEWSPLFSPFLALIGWPACWTDGRGRLGGLLHPPPAPFHPLTRRGRGRRSTFLLRFCPAKKKNQIKITSHLVFEPLNTILCYMAIKKVLFKL
jgi:hypothetical protein